METDIGKSIKENDQAGIKWSQIEGVITDDCKYAVISTHLGLMLCRLDDLIWVPSVAQAEKIIEIHKWD